ncbi:MAG: DUF2442 domain-containing protein [Gammaproteobacteria bacterium]
MASPDWVEKELRNNFAKASALGRRLARTEPRAASANYLPRKQALQIELTNGAIVQIPVRLVPHLRGVPVRVIRSVEVLGRGGGLHWEGMDLDLGVPELVASVFGGPGWMAELGRAGSGGRGVGSRRRSCVAAPEWGDRSRTHPSHAR